MTSTRKFPWHRYKKINVEKIQKKIKCGNSQKVIRRKAYVLDTNPRTRITLTILLRV